MKKIILSLSLIFVSFVNAENSTIKMQTIKKNAASKAQASTDSDKQAQKDSVKKDTKKQPLARIYGTPQELYKTAQPYPKVADVKVNYYEGEAPLTKIISGSFDLDGKTIYYRSDALGNMYFAHDEAKLDLVDKLSTDKKVKTETETSTKKAKAKKDSKK